MEERYTFGYAKPINDCVIEVARRLDPDKVNKNKDIPFPTTTNTDRQHELAHKTTDRLHNITENHTIYHLVALDESTDASDSRKYCILFVL